MDIQKNSFLSIDQLANQYLNNSRKTVKAAQENLVSFQEILQSKSNEQLKFSKPGSNSYCRRNHTSFLYGNLRYCCADCIFPPSEDDASLYS